MMLQPRWRRQSHRLERYLGALRRAPRPEPPADLDPELAALARRLTAARARLQPPAAFVDALRRQIEAAGDDKPSLSRDWRGPTIDRRRPSAPLATAGGAAGMEDTEMSRISSAPGDPPATVPKRLAREWLKIAAAVVAFVIVGTLLTLTLRDDGDDSNVPVGAPGPAPTATPPAPTPNAPDATATAGSAAMVPAVASPTADRVATAQAYVTATVEAAASATVAALATANAGLPGPGTVVASIQVGALPEIHAFAAGSLWVSNIEEQTLSRIDVATNTVVATIPVGSPTDHPATVSAWGDEIWVLNPADRMLLRIDSATNTITTTIDISDAGGSRLTDPQRLAVSDGAIWVSDTQNNRALRVDPQTQSVVASIADIGMPHSIGATADGIWVASVRSEQIVRIDPTTNTIVARIGTPDVGLNGVYVVGNEVWAGGPGHIVRLDPATNTIAESIALPAPIFFNAHSSIGVADGSIWFTATPEETLYHLDIATQSVTALLRTNTYFGPAYADGSLWLSGIEANTVARIDPTP